MRTMSSIPTMTPTTTLKPGWCFAELLPWSCSFSSEWKVSLDSAIVTTTRCGVSFSWLVLLPRSYSRSPVRLWPLTRSLFPQIQTIPVRRRRITFGTFTSLCWHLLCRFVSLESSSNSRTLLVEVSKSKFVSCVFVVMLLSFLNLLLRGKRLDA